MSNQSKYLCPICGADNMCTDFTDGFKWGRAYCNSCDCGGPEVRTGYEESLDAPWREEARKQFVEVVNEYVSKRCLEWVETTERLPVKEDAGIDGMVAFCYRDEWDCFNRLEKWDEIKPQENTHWHQMLKAPEVGE